VSAGGDNFCLQRDPEALGYCLDNSPLSLKGAVNSITLVFSENLGFVLIFLAVIAVAALIIAVINFARLRSLTGPFSWISGGDNTVDSLPALLGSVERLDHDVDVIKDEIEAMKVEGKRHFKRIGLVRYDAFDSLAGQQSYSLCLLDDNKNGVLISGLVGKDFSRSYAIEIAAGQASRKLGEEEANALKEALNRKAN
jgi:hypothetical protein